MADSPAFSFYAKDFMLSTIAMSLAERGAYITLLCYQWDRGAVPDTVPEIARILGCPVRQASTYWQSLAAKFPAGADGLRRNARLELERQKQVERRTKLVENGRLGGRPRKPIGSSSDNQTETKRFQFAKPNGNQNESLPSPSPSPVQPSVPEVRTLERVPPQEPRRRRPDSLVGKGEVLRFDEEQQRLHARCHREVCTYWTTEPTVRLCLTASQVAQFAGKLLSLPEAERVPTVIRWAQAHVPTVAELPSNLFRYWDEQWDLRPAAKPKRSAVPSPEETLAMIRRAEEMAGR